VSQMPPPAPEPMNTPPVAGRPGELLDRFLARLIDGLIIGVAYLILSAILRGIFLQGFVYSTGEWLLYWAVLTIIWVPLALGYFALMDSSRGQTFGKMALKLQVYGPNGGHPTMEQSVRRNIFYAFQLIAIIPILGGLVAGVATLIAVIMIAVGINSDTARRQGWHDHFAGETYVLKVG
jgi:uncharacterized RDD family membrane protein YckC